MASAALVNLLIKDKKYSKAQKISAELQAQKQTKPLGHELMGDLLNAQSKSSEALAEYQKSYDIRPARTTAQKIHRIHVQKADAKKAERIILDWLDKTPNDLNSRMLLADWYQAEKKAEQAILQYEEVLKLSENYLFALNNLAWIYMEKQNTRALDLAEKIEQLNPERADVLDTIGWIYVQFDKPEKGLALLQQATALDKDMREARYHTAVAHYKMGQKLKARELIEELVSSGKPFLGQDEAKELLKKL